MSLILIINEAEFEGIRLYYIGFNKRGSVTYVWIIDNCTEKDIKKTQETHIIQQVQQENTIMSCT